MKIFTSNGFPPPTISHHSIISGIGKSIEYMQDVIGTKPSKWCGGCHDHAIIFNGKMDTPIKEIVHTPEAQAGLSCTSCHSIVQVKSSMGQGDFTIEYPALHDLAASNNKWMEKLHDFLVYTDPEPHKQNLHEAVHAAGYRGVLFILPQGSPGCSCEQLQVVPRF